MNSILPRSRSSLEPLEARIAPAYVITVTDVTFTLPDTVVPGDKGSVSFTMTNVGDENYEGGDGVLIFLSPDANYSFSDVEVGHFSDSIPFLKKAGPGGIGGGKATQTKSFTVPPLQLPNPELPEGTLHVILDVRASNDYAFSTAHPYQFKFGNVDGRRVTLPAVDADGTEVKFNLTGAGTGDLDAVGGVVNMSFTGTDASSAATGSGAGGDGAVTINNLSADALMKKIALLKVDARGDLSFPGGFTTGLQLRDLGTPGGADHALTIGSVAGQTKGVQLVFRKVQEMDISAVGGIASLKINEWADTNGNPDSIGAPFITALQTTAKDSFTGGFSANLAITTGDAKGVGLGKMKIDGALTDAEFTIGTMTPVHVLSIGADDVTNFKLKATGDVKDVNFDSLNNASFTASEVALEARTFEDISISGAVNAPIIKATGATENKMAIKTLTLGRVDRLEVETPAGGILKLIVDHWASGGKVTSSFIGVVAAKGDKGASLAGDFNAALYLSGPDLLPDPNPTRKLDAPPGVRGSLTAVGIAGKLSGNWYVESSVVTVVAEEIDDWDLFGNATRGGLGVVRTEKNFNGKISMHRINNLSVGGDMMGKVTMKDDAWQMGAVLVGGSMLGTEFDIAGSTNSIAADEWKNGSFKGRDLGSLTLRGDKTAGITGNLQAVTFELTAFDESGAFTVAGSLFNVQFNNFAGHHLKAIKAASWSGGGIAGGSLGTLTLARGLGTATFALTGDTLADERGSLGVALIGGEMIDVTMTLEHGAKTIASAGMTRTNITTTAFLDVLTVRGLDGILPAFIQSNITAGTMETVSVRDVDGTTASEIKADKIDSYTRFVGDAKVSGHPLKKLDAMGTPDTAGQYKLTIL